MRPLLALAIAALAACTPVKRCDVTLSRDLAFTSVEARETVTVRSFGPSCDKAVALFELRGADGHPLWSWSAPLPQAFGDVFPADKPEQMRAFFERWAQPTLATTQQAPAWPLLAPGQTTLDQLTYDDIRARDLPMLCHASGTNRQVCVFWEPVAGAAGHLLDRDVEGDGP